MKRLAKAVDVKKPWLLKKEELKKIVQELGSKVKREFPRSKAIRDSFLNQLALEKAESNGTEFTTERKKLKTINYQRKLSRSVKWMLKKVIKNPYLLYKLA